MKRRHTIYSAAPPVLETINLSRADAINRILDAARRPCPDIVPVIEVLCDDGQWHRGFSLPWGVSSTGERRTVGYVFRGPDGCTYGTRRESAEEQRDIWTRIEDSKADDFRAILKGYARERLIEQAMFWLKANVLLTD